MLLAGVALATGAWLIPDGAPLSGPTAVVVGKEGTGHPGGTRTRPSGSTTTMSQRRSMPSGVIVVVVVGALVVVVWALVVVVWALVVVVCPTVVVGSV